MASRTLYIKNTEISILINVLSSLLGENVAKSLVNEKTLTGSFDFSGNYPKRLIISMKYNGEWVEVRYNTTNVLEKWGYFLSNELQTQVVILQLLNDFGWGYFALYDLGEIKRKFAIQDTGEYPFTEEGWNIRYQPLSEARKDVELGVEIDEGEYPKTEAELSGDFDYLSKGIDLIYEYCEMLGINLYGDLDNLWAKIDQGIFEEYTVLQSIEIE